MTDWTVTVEWRATDPLTEDRLFDVAAIGGAVSGAPGERDITTTLTVDADDMPAAAGRALELVLAAVPGHPVAVEVTTIDEADRRLLEPTVPELVGVAEIGDMLGVTRQRASALQTRQGFPAPVAVLRSGPVWRKADLTTFADDWTRQPGRPRKASV
jgi:hypothetical protein